MIIVEGPDGSGKSTLVKSLSADLGIDIEPKAVDDHGRYMTDMVSWTEGQLSKGFRRILYDRFNLISDPIYRPLMGGYLADMYSPGWMLPIMQIFYRLRPILIYCLPPLSDCMYNVAHGEDDNSAVAGFTDKLWYAYSAKMAADMATAGPQAHTVYHYDYTNKLYPTRQPYQSLQSSLRFHLKRRLDADR